jgi:hypothetical protein
VPRVNVDSSFFGDPRIDALARLANISKQAARGHLLSLWHYCYAQISEIVTHSDADIHAEWFSTNGKSFGELLVLANLADRCLMSDGSIRVRGIGGRISYLLRAREAGIKSAQTRKEREGTAQPSKVGPRSSNLPSERSSVVETPNSVTIAEGTPKVSPRSGNLPSGAAEPLALALDLDLAPALALALAQKSEEKKSVLSTKQLSTGKQSTRVGRADDSPPASALVEVWNAERGPLPAVQSLTASRERHAKARLKEQPDLEVWRKVVRRIRDNPWCCGQNERGWVATFDYLCRAKTWLQYTEDAELSRENLANTSGVWAAYREAYQARYGQEPIVNSKQLELCHQLCLRLGDALAPQVAKFYVSHSGAFYSQQLHPLTLAVRDAEKLHTEWKAGVQMTSAMSREGEMIQNNRQAIAVALGRSGNVAG